MMSGDVMYLKKIIQPFAINGKLGAKGRLTYKILGIILQTFLFIFNFLQFNIESLHKLFEKYMMPCPASCFFSNILSSVLLLFSSCMHAGPDQNFAC